MTQSFYYRNYTRYLAWRFTRLHSMPTANALKGDCRTPR